jgi:hypothetical protein
LPGTLEKDEVRADWPKCPKWKEEEGRSYLASCSPLMKCTCWTWILFPG